MKLTIDPQLGLGVSLTLQAAVAAITGMAVYSRKDKQCLQCLWPVVLVTASLFSHIPAVVVDSGADGQRKCVIRFKNQPFELNLCYFYNRTFHLATNSYSGNGTLKNKYGEQGTETISM